MSFKAICLCGWNGEHAALKGDAMLDAVKHGRDCDLKVLRIGEFLSRG